MIIIVNYLKESSEKAKALINKIADSKNMAEADMKSILQLSSYKAPSFVFFSLKKFLFDEAPSFKKDIVLDGHDLQKELLALDELQRSFLFKTLESFGAICVSVDGVSVDYDKFETVGYNSSKDFFIDFEKSLDAKTQKIKEDPAYKLLTEMSQYGYYLGNCLTANPPKKVVSLYDSTSGHTISFDEYSSAVIDILKETQASSIEEAVKDVAFVRSRHMLEIFAKKFSSKNK